jgi:hypothetical protein
MKVQIKIGRDNTWYQECIGQIFDVEEIPNGYGDHKLIDCSDGYNRWINKHDFVSVFHKQ